MAKSTVSAGKDQDRLVAALAYLVFFLPLIITPGSKFGRYHASQGLNLLVLGVAVRFIGLIIPFFGWFVIWPLGSLAVLVLFVIGFANAITGQKKPLPLIGQYELIR